jgi:hypothetical protein
MEGRLCKRLKLVDKDMSRALKILTINQTPKEKKKISNI